MTTILIGIALALTFALSNAFSYKRGETEGYFSGLQDGIQAELKKVNDKEYKVILK